MNELVQWLDVQLSIDEQYARDAAHFEAGNWTTEDGYPVSVADELPDAADTFERVVVFDEGSPSAEQARHIAEWDPARVLREIEAKRQLLDEHQDVNDGSCGTCVDGQWGYPTHGGSSPQRYPCRALRFLALPYADRPGYREEWRP